ncbi:tetratricopeptide repeat-containing S1 family peptidase [Chamaesiphon polymorphus]|uniref:Uncharacterized protein n=1 Tax=Chamaesiphon polymorphus CCALA 037 TaxID=2107692 RepID=A0A2T1GII4_9CYAN|nr:tetratricopeptide repeat-containing serine protease family protein [Chamaesiphon polymorphus]PSB57447.1 hypothetical protein C7B77_08305 [Chamaesiphon polymorphus CCALA 037]
MKFPSFLLCTTVVIVCIVDTATAQTPAEIQSIAKAVTVEINLVKDRSLGSGVLVHQQGNLYTLITNRHVVCGKKRTCSMPLSTETFQLKFGNGSSLQVPATAVKILSKDLDLATIQFSSNTPYQIAQIAPPSSLKVGDRVYTSGYPAEPRGFSFNDGDAMAVVKKRLTEDRGGYTVIYDAQTQPGMSGGGVFDNNGRIVAIHGQGERYRDNTELPEVSKSVRNTTRSEIGSKIGYNRGIPVRWVVERLAQQGIKLGDEDPTTPASAAVTNTADEYFIAGFNKWVEPGDDIRAGKQQAIQAFSQTIRLNPRYTITYFLRAFIYAQLKEYRLSLADYNQAIALNPNFARAYNNRGLLKKNQLNDAQGALADYNQAIALNPNFALAHYNRAILKEDKLNDAQGALTDYNQAIALDPKFAVAYYNRANLKTIKLNDAQGALADYNQAIALKPNFALAYNNRANLKTYDLNDDRGALADYDQAIALDPNFAQAYGARGRLKYIKLNARSGGIADTQKAAELAKSQGNTQLLEFTLTVLQSWGVR